MIPQPRYSIVVPAYNVEDYIGECIESILSQQRTDIEIVIVDDGSTDSTRSVVERYARDQAPIRLIHQENRGLLAARRAGYAKARGEYILSVDGDDGLLRGAVDAIDEAIGLYDADCVTFGFTRKPGALQRQQVPKTLPLSRPRREDMVALLASTRQVNSIWSKCARRARMGVDVDFSRYGRLQLGEDLLQSITIIERSGTFVHIDAPLYYYRHNAASITKTFKDSYFTDVAVARNEVHALIAREDLGRGLEQAACAVDYMQVIDVAGSLCRSSVPKDRASELLGSVVDSDFYRHAVEGVGSVGNLRFEYLFLAPLLTGRRYGAFRMMVRFVHSAAVLYRALKKK